ncbi:DUF1064 domain-containing protein [Ochrobactrum sp. CGA5]|uniref:DUF1064 domain-containing protein n=1 Tax=Ochrobactrum sp. CGA5 TaxID=2583453 RepID=UPI00112056C8|nr:DUF1064 domain-containing protein [Ochrobactrum sp. CGA5]
MRMSAAEFHQTARRNKYGAKKTTLDGITFDSKAEARFYAELKQREKAGEVGGVELQRPFVILGPKGELITTYRADFAFWDFEEDRFRVIDVKGVETPVFRLKRKLVKSFLGIDVEVVK